MRIGLINIGDEILAGKILNTNARDLALWLAELGHELAFAWTVPDGVDALAGSLRNLLDAPGGPFATPRCDLLILSGGLGPTHDDRTREAIAAYLDAPLERNAEAAGWLAERLDVEAGAIPPGQATQLLAPRGVTPLCNPAGTACGLRFDRVRADGSACAVFTFPGVPSEFRALFYAHCRPLLERRDAILLRRRAITFGLAESRQRECLRGFTVPEPFRFSSLPNASGVTIALEAFVPAAEADRLQAVLDAAWEDLLARLPPGCIVDRTGSPLPETVYRLLRDRRATVSVAESCTGGLVGNLITSVPGSSEIFERGFLTYSDAAKREILGVSAGVLEAHGAVSEETARAMARGCLAAARSNYAIAVTGIAGPDGGTPDKPVGLVYIAVEAARGDRLGECARFLFREDREGNRRLSAYAALNLLRLLILKESGGK